jgi:hypothetical protein
LIARTIWILIILFVLAGTFDSDADPRLPHPQTTWGIFFLTVAGLLVLAHIVTAMIDARNDGRFGRNVTGRERGPVSASRALTRRR